jgi:tetratricopeptide (TPR) repeat protein/TolB-like protein
MADFIQEIKARRVLPAVGFYVGSCWVLVEILDRLVERYLLSPYFTDIAFCGLFSFIPAVVLIAWTHGKPGKDTVTTAEKVGVPVNLIATIGLLVTAFGGKDLGATANLVTINNEEGIAEQHYIPNDSYRRRATVFFFNNVSGSEELDWLQYGLTDLLDQDLSQSSFMSVNSPWDNLGVGFYAHLKNAGFEDGLGVPRSLMAQITSSNNRQYFIEGDVDQLGDEYQLTARLWDSRTVQQIASFTETGWDLYATTDRLTVSLQEAMGVPKGTARIAQDLPLAETYGESQQAFKDFISAMNARLFDNDMAASNAFLESSVAADDGFVRSWFQKILNSFDAGDLPAAQAAVQKAQELDYRLPAVDRAAIKGLNYRLSGQQDKLVSFLQMQVRLRGDANSHNTLATVYMAMGRLEEARDEFLVGLGKDSMNLGILLQLASLEKGSGNMEGAIEYVRQYLEQKPDDSVAQLRMGDFLRDNGDLDGAENHYQQAAMLDNEPVEATLKMALLELRKGDENSARSLIEEAEAMAETALSRAQVRNAAIYTEARMGRLNAALGHLDRLEEILSEIMPAFQVAISVYGPRIQYNVELHNVEAARVALDEVMAMLQPPMDQFMAFSEAAIALEERDFELVEVALARGEEIIDQFKLEELRIQTDILTGFLYRLQGDHAASADSFRTATERISRAVMFLGTDTDLFLPPLNANMAKSLTSAGKLDEAAEALEIGFSQDPSEPLLWVSKALHQQASGMPQLALASVNYALAIWQNADPDYREFRQALDLKASIEAGL